MTMPPQDHDPQNPHGLPSSFDEVLWLSMLLNAIIDVPSVANIVSLVIPKQQALLQVSVFIVACWVSTWIGMWLMRKSRSQPPIVQIPPSHNE